MKFTIKELKKLIRETVKESLHQPIDDEHIPGTYAHHDAAFDRTEPRYVGHGEEGFYRYMMMDVVKKMAKPGMTPEDLALKLGLGGDQEVIDAIAHMMKEV